MLSIIMLKMLTRILHFNKKQSFQDETYFSFIQGLTKLFSIRAILLSKGLLSNLEIFLVVKTREVLLALVGRRQECC